MVGRTPPGPRGTPASRRRHNDISILHGTKRPTGASAAVQGDRPTSGAVCSLLGKVCGIGHSCLPRPHSWGRSWFDTVSHPLIRVSRRVSTRQARVPAPRRRMGCEKCGPTFSHGTSGAAGLFQRPGMGVRQAGQVPAASNSLRTMRWPRRSTRRRRHCGQRVFSRSPTCPGRLPA